MNRKLQFSLISVKYTLPLFITAVIMTTGCKHEKNDTMGLLAMAGVLSMNGKAPSNGQVPSCASGGVPFIVGGNVTGLLGSGLKLTNNGADTISVSADGTFTFPTGIADGGVYDVQVGTQPMSPNQTCTASNNAGTIQCANALNVSVVCATDTVTIGGTVSGLTGTVILQNNGADNLTLSANGTFTFLKPIAWGGAFKVTVLTQPSGQSCLVSNGSGTLTSANITDISVACSPVHLDMTFNTTGTAVHDNAAGGSQNDAAYSVAVDSVGKIVVTGSSWNGTDNDMVIWRYNTNGSLDTTFNTKGYVAHNNAGGGNGMDAGYAVAIDAAGKIVVTGYSSNGTDYDMTIWRYNSNGTLDTTFNTTGVVTHNNAGGGNGMDAGNAVAIDATGKIVISGFSWNGTDFDMAIWRYNSNGTPDTTFNATGVVTHNNAGGGNGDDTGLSLAIDAAGKIVISGFSLDVNTQPFLTIWRYNSNGTLDAAGFNGTGYLVESLCPGMGSAVAVDAGGKIVATGSCNSGLGQPLPPITFRYNTNGTSDTTFNTTGFNSAPFISVDIPVFGVAMAIDAAGKTVVSGMTIDPVTFLYKGLYLWRYNANGALDTTFNGGTGYIAVPDGNGWAMGIDAGGNILVTGSRTNAAGNEDMALWRFLP